MRNVIKATSRTSRQRNPQEKCQSGSKNAKSDPTVPCPLSAFCNGHPLHVVIKIPLCAHAAAELENVGGNNLGIQFHIVAGSLPKIARVAEQLVYLVWLSRIKLERFEREINPA